MMVKSFKVLAQHICIYTNVGWISKAAHQHTCSMVWQVHMYLNRSPILPLLKKQTIPQSKGFDIDPEAVPVCVCSYHGPTDRGSAVVNLYPFTNQTEDSAAAANTSAGPGLQLFNLTMSNIAVPSMNITNYMCSHIEVPVTEKHHIIRWDLSVMCILFSSRVWGAAMCEKIFIYLDLCVAASCSRRWLAGHSLRPNHVPKSQ